MSFSENKELKNNIVMLSSFKADDDVKIWNYAMNYLSKHPGTTLVAEKRVYNISGDVAKQTMNDVIGMKYGVNPEKEMFRPDFPYDTGIFAKEIKDCTVIADGCTLMVDGFMEPVAVKNCVNFKIQGLTIDHKRKPYSKGIVVNEIKSGLDTAEITVKFPKEYPLSDNADFPRYVLFDCYANRFVGYGEIKISSPVKKAYQTFSFKIKNPPSNVVGMELYCWHTFHSRPAVFVENCENIDFEYVTIHSQPGMGIVSHRTSGIHLNRLRIVPSAGEHMSTNTDALHFTSCKGDVVVENCVFDGQGDDALNIHTYYHKIEKLSDCKCRIFLDSPTKTHSQTPDYPDNDDILELTDCDTLCVKGLYKVIERKESGPWSSELLLDKQLPEDCEKCFFANASQQPNLIFRNNLSRNHLARGTLVKVKNAQIIDNTFTDVVGTAIYVAAESWWREGVCTTENIIIKRNRILFCGRTDDIRQRDTAGICVTIDADNPAEKTHKNVVIADNIIDCPDSPVGIYISNTEKYAVENNDVMVKTTPIVIKD